MEEAETQGEERNQNMEPDSGGIENTDSYCQGEQKSSKEKGHISYDDDSVLGIGLFLLSLPRIHPVKSKCVPPSNLIEIDDNIVETKKGSKWKRNVSKEQGIVSKSVKKSGSNEDFDDDIEVIAENCKARIKSFKKRSVIRGRVITGFGRNEMGELLVLLQAQGWSALFLQGNRRRKMAEVLSTILGVPNVGWCHYVKRTWPPLEGLLLALEISRRFVNDPMLEDYTRVDKRAMRPLHKLLFDIVHKIILPRKHKRTEANYLDLTLMELLISQMTTTMGLGMGSGWERFLSSFKFRLKSGKCKVQKMFLGEVDHVVIPATSRGANAPMQHLRALLTVKGEEIAALKVSHSAAMDQLHISYGLENAGLDEENSRLKEEIATTQATLETERTSNSAHLKYIVDLLAKGSPSSSSCVPPPI
ncbi:hypothetical protein KY290_016961 [Solanum tuberosum]|uniref:Uncharacterized protein n=1 Tax=Solanum tuberosum TaxID=4113 RepID=A0ABQ7VAT2_SOLTU|nr:hypothetical protein KY284_016036 [Solanum tuberosum]KAH0701752.1 hypothetical protein KY285_016030 [Solanum tuberosum]KAH0760888.1 hypothetical protein KY290_016961 [Solanum tuberosum]